MKCVLVIVEVRAASLATGFGNYLAMPLLRRYVEDEDYASLDEDKARRVLEESLRVLFYRDCVTTCDVQLAFIRKDGTAVVEPAFRLSSSWEVYFCLFVVSSSFHLLMGITNDLRESLQRDRCKET